MTNTSWSPLACLPPQPLTPAGLIQFEDASEEYGHNAVSSEVELLSRVPCIELRSLSTRALTPIDTSIITSKHNKWIDRDEGLLVTVTTHRIVFQTTSSSSNTTNYKERAHFLHWSNVRELEPTGGDWISNRSYKIDVQTHSYDTLQIIFRTNSFYNTNPKSNRDTMYNVSKRALDRQAWLDVTKLQIKKSKAQKDIMKNKVGVDAILAKNKQRHERAAKLTNEAFGTDGARSKKAKKENIDTFMREAGELVQVIQKYVATLDKKSKVANKGHDHDDQTEQQLTDMLQNMGMITGASKKTASEYHEVLARQLSDFLQHKNRLRNAGGIITLTDLYCLFNRARGSNMISPEDLWDSIKIMEKLNIGGQSTDGLSWCRLRQFEDSGVWVLQEGDFDDNVMAKKLIDFIEEQEQVERKARNQPCFVGLTTLDASRILKIPPMLAEEQLLSAERKGYLCRDITLESIRFYSNIFQTTLC